MFSFECCIDERTCAETTMRGKAPYHGSWKYTPPRAADPELKAIQNNRRTVLICTERKVQNELQSLSRLRRRIGSMVGLEAILRLLIQPPSSMSAQSGHVECAWMSSCQLRAQGSPRRVLGVRACGQPEGIRKHKAGVFLSFRHHPGFPTLFSPPQ
jgi:hypothetical protein